MPCKKKSISHCIFKFTRIYLQAGFMCIWDVWGCVWPFLHRNKPHTRVQTSADDWRIHDELIRKRQKKKKIHHAAPAVHHPVTVHAAQQDLHSIKCPSKREKRAKKVQLIAEGTTRRCTVRAAGRISFIFTWKIHRAMALLDSLQMKDFSANMTKGLEDKCMILKVVWSWVCSPCRLFCGAKP